MFKDLLIGILLSYFMYDNGYLIGHPIIGTMLVFSMVYMVDISVSAIVRTFVNAYIKTKAELEAEKNNKEN